MEGVMMFDFIVWAQSLIVTFGYLGIMFIAFISTVSLLLPTFPLSALIVFAVALKLNPVILAVCAGFGSATGELVGFGVGAGGKKVLLKKYKKRMDKMERLFEKYGGAFVIFVFSFLPFVPVDLMGVFSGIIGYDIKKFYIACLLGKTMRYMLLALGAYYGIGVATDMLGIEY